MLMLGIEGEGKWERCVRSLWLHHRGYYIAALGLHINIAVQECAVSG